jgi:hypothetical protein
MKGLRAGGLAMVYGLRVATEDNGKIVTLLRVVYPGQYFTRPTDGARRLAGDWDGVSWLVIGDVTAKYGYGYGLFDPKNLMPIDDDPDKVGELERGKPVGVSHA